MPWPGARRSRRRAPQGPGRGRSGRRPTPRCRGCGRRRGGRNRRTATRPRSPDGPSPTAAAWVRKNRTTRNRWATYLPVGVMITPEPAGTDAARVEGWDPEAAAARRPRGRVQDQSAERSDSSRRSRSCWDKATGHPLGPNWQFTKDSCTVACPVLRERSPAVDAHEGTDTAHFPAKIRYTTPRSRQGTPSAAQGRQRMWPADGEGLLGAVVDEAQGTKQALRLLSVEHDRSLVLLANGNSRRLWVFQAVRSAVKRVDVRQHPTLQPHPAFSSQRTLTC